MSSRKFALVFGLLFLAIGIAGFVPALVWPPEGGELAMNNVHGMLLGSFPVSVVHNAVHLLFGLLGLAASRSVAQSVRYARLVALAYLAATVAGMIPGLDDMFGLMPLYGNNLWLHLGLAAFAAYFGWVNRNPTMRFD
jgi:hypothetical protein